MEVLRLVRDSKYIVDESLPLAVRQNVIKSAVQIRKIFDNINEEAKTVGMDITDMEDFFPRQWNRKAINKNRNKFQRDLIESGEVKAKISSGEAEYLGKTDFEVADVIIDRMLRVEENLSKAEGSIMGNRTLTLLSDNVFEEFLNKDVRTLTQDYIMSASMKIQRQKHYGLD